MRWASFFTVDAVQIYLSGPRHSFRQLLGTLEVHILLCELPLGKGWPSCHGCSVWKFKARPSCVHLGRLPSTVPALELLGHQPKTVVTCCNPISPSSQLFFFFFSPCRYSEGHSSIKLLPINLYLRVYLLGKHPRYSST